MAINFTPFPKSNNIDFKPLGSNEAGAALTQSQMLLNPKQQVADDLSAKTTGATFPAETGESPLAAGAKAVGNLPSSFLNLGKGIASAAMHPIETIKGLGKTAIGGFERAGEALGIKKKGETTPSEQTFDVVAKSLKDRYGSLENLQRTATNDPAGFGTDVLSLISGGAGLLGKGAETTELLSAPGKIVEDIAGKAGNKLAKGLEESSLRLTPTQKMNLGKKLDTVKQYLVDNNFVGTPERRLAKADNLINKSEDKLQDFLKKDAKGVTVDRNEFLAQLEGLKSKYQTEGTDVLDLEKQVDRAKNVIQQRYPAQIPLDTLNEFKRATYKNAYNVSGAKVLDDVEHDIADVAKTTIENKTKGMTLDGKSIQDFNKEYGTLVQAKKLLKTAAARPQLGSWGKLSTRLISGLLGWEEGGFAGLVGGEVVGVPIMEHSATPLRSAGGFAAKNIPKIAGKIKIPSSAVPAISLDKTISDSQKQDESQ